jgi:hypothetical protein
MTAKTTIYKITVANKPQRGVIKKCIQISMVLRKQDKRVFLVIAVTNQKKNPKRKN